jgi:nucleoside-diphosphate-sugar epimerase
MRVFVTGATGAIGRRAVPLLVELGHQVTAVGRTPEKRAGLERLGARAVDVNLFDAAAVRRAIGDAEAICNLATAVPPGVRGFLPWSWRAMDRIRRRVSANLVDAALAGGTVGRIVQESFAPIYADGGDSWLDESAAVRPARYNRSVLDAEEQADRFTHAGRTGMVLRFGFLYGPGDAMTLQLVDAVRRGWYPLFGRPEGYSSWAAHEDAATAVVAALGVPAGVYNVVDDQPLRRRELADGIARLVGAKPPRFLPAWATPLGGVVGGTLARSLRVSNRKLRRVGGWEPRYRTAVEGFEEVIERAERAAKAERTERSGTWRRQDELS